MKNLKIPKSVFFRFTIITYRKQNKKINEDIKAMEVIGS